MKMQLSIEYNNSIDMILALAPYNKRIIIPWYIQVTTKAC